ncbi:MAG: hypothetical protein GY854_35350 [Deltaproteobacteria bacterium]|nr:hypothetical protein [Deltaproteobacteria bacterium]
MEHSVDSQRARLALWTALALGLLHIGCASMSNREEIRRRFQEMHGCGEARVGRSPGSSGYVASGCGITSYFACFDTRSKDDSILFTLMFGEDNDVCFHEFSRGRYTHNIDYEPLFEERVTEDGNLLLRASFLVGDGPLVLAAVPAQYADQVGIVYNSLVPWDPPEDCRVSFFADGTPFPAEKTIVTDSAEKPQVRFIVGDDTLGKLASARHLSVEICGRLFQLSKTHLGVLSKFHARFREEVARRQRTQRTR